MTADEVLDIVSSRARHLFLWRFFGQKMILAKMWSFEREGTKAFCWLGCYLFIFWQKNEVRFAARLLLFLIEFCHLAKWERMSELVVLCWLGYAFHCGSLDRLLAKCQAGSVLEGVDLLYARCVSKVTEQKDPKPCCFVLLVVFKQHLQTWQNAKQISFCISWKRLVCCYVGCYPELFWQQNGGENMVSSRA